MREHLKLPPGLHGNVWRYHNPTVANVKHHHAELELNLVTRGSGTYLLGNRKYQIRPGDLLWLFPAQEHVLINYTPDFEMWIAVFQRRLVKRVVLSPGERVLAQPQPIENCCRRLLHPDCGRMEDLLEEVSASAGNSDLLNAGLGYILLRAWHTFQRAAEIAGGNVHPAVERAARLIRDESVALSLDELAQRVGLSPPRLSRLFKEQTGFPMVDFRNRIRIQRYLEIYGSGNRFTVLDAALQAGFGSYPQFHRVFRRILGCSPANYPYQRKRPLQNGGRV